MNEMTVKIGTPLSRTYRMALKNPENEIPVGRDSGRNSASRNGDTGSRNTSG